MTEDTIKTLMSQECPSCGKQILKSEDYYECVGCGLIAHRA